MNELIFPQVEDSAVAPPPEPSHGYVCFMLADQRYGVEVSQVREVLKLSELAWVPGAPNSCLGVVNLRGRIVSVLDLRRLLGLAPAQADKQSRLLVIDHADGVVALLVDRVLELKTVLDRSVEMAPKMNHGPVPISGVVSESSGPLFLLQPEKILPSGSGSYGH